MKAEVKLKFKRTCLLFFSDTQGSSWRETWEKISPKTVPLFPLSNSGRSVFTQAIYMTEYSKRLSLLFKATENYQNFSLFQICRITPELHMKVVQQFFIIEAKTYMYQNGNRSKFSVHCLMIMHGMLFSLCGYVITHLNSIPWIQNNALENMIYFLTHILVIYTLIVFLSLYKSCNILTQHFNHKEHEKSYFIKAFITVYKQQPSQ